MFHENKVKEQTISNKEPKVKVVKEPKVKADKEPKVKVVKEPKVKAVKEPKVKEVKAVKETKKITLLTTPINENIIINQTKQEVTLTMTEINNIEIVTKPKRGRKPLIKTNINQLNNSNDLISSDASLQTNGVYKNEIINPIQNNFLAKIVSPIKPTDDKNDSESESGGVIDEDNIIKQVAKKRGRKPKGGKIISQSNVVTINKMPKPNIILHLKCFMKDLQEKNILSNNHVESFNFPSNNNSLNFDILNSKNNININNYSSNELVNEICNNESDSNIVAVEDNDKDDNMQLKKNDKNDQKELWKKLKLLEHNLHINNISDKKSCCFWDTYEFDGPPVYIPKHFIKDTYNVYGCFCSPECAVAYLMNENIDISVKFERYHLLNLIYGKIYDYIRNVKPAPIPHYMLERFYGNLNIQEYRSLLRKDRIFLIVDKPLTRILPELHEDNDDFILNNKIIPSNNFQIKKKIQKNNNKNINEQFGLSTNY